MLISNDLFESVCMIDNVTSKDIANELRLNLKDLVYTGHMLSDSLNNGYLKATELIIKLLLADVDSKKNILNQINTYKLSYHLNYSCKSCFKDRFIQAINKFKIEVENYNLNLLSI